MKKIITALLISITILPLGLSLAGCDSMTNQDVGTVSGGVLGGLVGSRFGSGGGQIAAIGVGALSGAYIGGQIGRSMDQADRAHMSNAFENNAIGEPMYWRNDNTGIRYDIVPTRNVDIEGNQYCREYRSTAVIAGKTQQVYGTACRQQDGSWQIINSN
jgi:surface antigen